MRALEAGSWKFTACAGVIGLTAAFAAGCGGQHGDDNGSGHQGTTSTASAGGTGGGAHGSTSDGTGGDLFNSSGSSGGAGGASSFAVPHDFVKADVGAYALGAPLTGEGVADTGVDAGSGCKILVGVVRDFRGITEPDGDPDFEAFWGVHATTGLVGIDLGQDDKPVYGDRCDDAGWFGCPYGHELTTKANFDEWYRYTPGVNKPYLVYLQFDQDPTSKVATFSSHLFFPVDGAGYGLSGTGDDGKQHNFSFTTEIHTKIMYSGGERFTFAGDDDLWVFINKKLAIDLGGLHPPATATVDLDLAAQALGLQRGNVYPLELFHAERHSSGSNFRVDTNLGFVDCGSVQADPK